MSLEVFFSLIAWWIEQPAGAKVKQQAPKNSPWWIIKTEAWNMNFALKQLWLLQVIAGFSNHSGVHDTHQMSPYNLANDNKQFYQIGDKHCYRCWFRVQAYHHHVKLTHLISDWMRLILALLILISSSNFSRSSLIFSLLHLSFFLLQWCDRQIIKWTKVLDT